jgi:NAD(P)-dependent dehydrogenase (short-subunit alcohol dehydrogenase family)
VSVVCVVITIVRAMSTASLVSATIAGVSLGYLLSRRPSRAEKPEAVTAIHVSPESSTEHEGSVIIVTGGANGIGSGICRAFVAAGAHVWCADVDEASGRMLSLALEELPGTFKFQACDVASAAAVTRFVDAVAAAHDGRIDVLVNNVGVQLDDGHPLHTLDEAVWDRVLAINLKSYFLFSKHCLPRMLTARHGVVVNMASVQGLQSQGGIPAYAASKGAILSLTRQMAMDYAAHGVRVVAINPGTIRTPLVEKLLAARHSGDTTAAWQVTSARFELSK